MTAQVIANMALLGEAPDGVPRLRELILELAVTGRLCAAESDWTATRLGELVVSSGAGWSPSCEARPRSGDEWGVLKVSAVSWSQFRPEENKALPAHLSPRKELEVQSGDFLVSRANTIELVARSVVVQRTPPKLMLSDKIVRLRLSEACDPRFVQLANSAPASRRYYARVAGGTSSSMKNVSREQILALPILLPPLCEQHRIVAKVDELMALCDRLEARQQDAEAAHAQLVQALLDSLTQARDANEFRAGWKRLEAQLQMVFTTEASLDGLKDTVLELALTGRLVEQSPAEDSAAEILRDIATVNARMVAEEQLRTTAKEAVPAAEHYLPLPAGWAFARLGNLVRFIDYRGRTPIKTASGTPLITAKNVRRGHISREPREYIATEAYDAWMTRGIPRVGDLLFTTEAPLGNIALIDIDERIALAQRVICFQLQRLELGPFLRIALMSRSVQAQIAAMATGMTATGVKASRLKELPLPIPPEAEQHRIVAKVTELLALCDQLKARIAAARAKHAQLAEALVAQAVTA